MPKSRHVEYPYSAKKKMDICSIWDEIMSFEASGIIHDMSFVVKDIC